MELPEKLLQSIFTEVVNEYNKSDLAAISGYTYTPNNLTLNEIRECLNALPSENSTILDIGTGKGIVPRFFKKLGCRTISLDNPLSGSDALTNLTSTGIEIIEGDILKDTIPMTDSSVNCILFGDVIEHLIHSPKPAIKEFLRILVPGGCCVASTPNSLRLSARIRLLLGYSNWPMLTEFYNSEYHGGHHHEYTLNEFKYAFEASGFKILKTSLQGTVTSVQVPRFSDLNSKYRANDTKSHPLITLGKIPIYFLEKLIPNFRPTMLLVAQKA